MSATVKVIEGVGTERARVTAEVTTEDVRDYCENWYPGADRLAAQGQRQEQGDVLCR